jgi:hypothetical protein
MADAEFFVPAARYLRMSAEHQQYSTENQSTAIRTYAEGHGFTVVRTYSDPAMSGLFLKNRRLASTRLPPFLASADIS